MIAFLNGELVSVEPGAVVLDVGGVGYQILTSNSTLNRLPSPGEKVKLFTRLIVRDDELQIYGFISPEELSLFLHLVSVNGVGPKGAMSVLSSFAPETFRGAVFEENVNLLSRVPGVGKKTARRIILELKDKLGPVDSPVVQKDNNAPLSTSEEAVSALIGLGYRQGQARATVARVIEQKGKDLKIEDLVKYSLKLLDNAF